MDIINLKNNCAIVVNSCDAYEDVWELFFRSLKHNWPECDLDIYLNTETKIYNFNGLKLNKINTNSVSNKTWGSRLLSVLNNIDKEYVITLFDDFVLEKHVNIEKIKTCILEMQRDSSISVFYLSHSPGSNSDDKRFKDFELMGQRNDYRLNSAPAIWRRKKIIQYTGSIDNPWAWEFFGSARTYYTNDKFYCSKINKEDVFVYNYNLGGAIRRGKWVASVVKPLLVKHDLNIDLEKRGIASENLNEGKYSLKWKIDFFILGFRMVGIKAFIFIFRVLKKKLLKK